MMRSFPLFVIAQLLSMQFEDEMSYIVCEWGFSICHFPFPISAKSGAHI